MNSIVGIHCALPNNFFALNATDEYWGWPRHLGNMITLLGICKCEYTAMPRAFIWYGCSRVRQSQMNKLTPKVPVASLPPSAIGLGLKGTKWIMTGVAKTYLADVLLDGLCSLILSWNLLKGGFLPRH